MSKEETSDESGEEFGEAEVVGSALHFTRASESKQMKYLIRISSNMHLLIPDNSLSVPGGFPADVLKRESNQSDIELCALFNLF